MLSPSITQEESLCPICSSKGTLTCSGCSLVSYCSPVHQKEHWKEHKRSCRPYVVKRNEVFGRYLVAPKDLPTGTIVLTEPPLVVGPKRSSFPVCLGCGRRVDCTYRCTKCGFPMCGEKCEKNSSHSTLECPIFSSTPHLIGPKITDPNSIHPAYESVTPLRCLLLRDREPKKWEALNTMEHHNELRRTQFACLWNANEVNTVKLLREWYKLKEYEPEEIHKCIGFIDVNCFEVKWGDIELCGVYPLAGLMLHDCSPNTHHASTANGSMQMIVRTSIPIKKGDIISNSYCDCFTPTTKRRLHLKATKYFDCLCKRCLDPTEFGTYLGAVKCKKCKFGYLLPLHPTETADNEVIGGQEWRCGDCDCRVKFEQVRNIYEKVEKEIELVDGSEAAVGSKITKYERLLKKFGGTLVHPNNYLLFGVMKKLVKLYGGDGPEILERKRELCQKILELLDSLEPGLTRLRGVTLHTLATCEFPLAKLSYEKGESTREKFQLKCHSILAYLRTAKEILDFERLIVDYPKISLLVDQSIDTICEEMRV